MIHIDLRIPPESGNITGMWIIPTTIRKKKGVKVGNLHYLYYKID